MQVKGRKREKGGTRISIWEGAGQARTVCSKRILIRRVLMVLKGEKKRAWEIHTVCPIGSQEHFLSSSFWEG